MHCSCGRKCSLPRCIILDSLPGHNPRVAALLAAFSFRFFLETTTFTRALVGTVGGLVGGLVVLSIIYTWEVQPDSNARLRQRSDDKLRTYISEFWRKLSTFGRNLHHLV